MFGRWFFISLFITVSLFAKPAGFHLVTGDASTPTQSGDIALFAKRVENQGTLDAPQGRAFIVQGSRNTVKNTGPV